jgi:FAD/FMN-containing dehydrogenase/Fe-S oxidoreductase
MTEVEKALKKCLKGEVLSDRLSQIVYSVDASIFQIPPKIVVIPRDEEDLVETIKIGKQFEMPITLRGAGTGITGGALGEGIVVDTSQHLNHILEIDYEKETVVVEPGVIQDDLNRALKHRGYRLGPETSTGNRATLGGMLGNNAAGARSLRYGTFADALLSCDVILSNGEKITLNEKSTHTVAKKLLKLREKYATLVLTELPHLPRRVSGYHLECFLKDPFNPSLIMAGSEGTLGVVSQMTLKIVKEKPFVGQALIFFKEFLSLFNTVDLILSLNPLSFELIDDKILYARSASYLWLKQGMKALLIVEFDGESLEDVEKQLKTFQTFFPESYCHTDFRTIAEVRDLRKRGLGILMSKRTYSQAIAFIEDIAVPPRALKPFMMRFLTLLKQHGKEAGIYGHIGSGCLHIRPYIDLRQKEEIETLKVIMLEVTALLKEFQGALSGEHGDGLIRSFLNLSLFGPNLYQVQKEIKNLFDPTYLLNPKKIIGGEFNEKDLKLHPGKITKEFETFQDFSKEGGLPLSAEMCNGNGQCRKKEGVMCPSFQATRQEKDTTRARAETLRELIHSEAQEDDLSSETLHEVLDLCLSCKGCLKECPSSIDMAKIKQEALYQYQKKNGRNLRDFLFTSIGKTPFPRVMNALIETKLIRGLLFQIGITKKRPLPKLAEKSFSDWVKKQSPQEGKPVVLFSDTLTEFYEPQIGMSAYKVLTALGFKVIVPPWSCCGRAQLSKGFLEEAQERGKAVLKTLLPFAEKGIPIIGLEPSCLFTLKHDLKALRLDAELIEKACVLFDTFVNNHLDRDLKPFPKTVYLHGHCHQKAHLGMSDTLSLLRKIKGIDLYEIPSGCCGMAGSFGYEKEHYDLSMQIGELVLFPALREAKEESVIIASGSSCRTQIAHGTKRKAIHIAEFLTALF